MTAAAATATDGFSPSSDTPADTSDFEGAPAGAAAAAGGGADDDIPF